MKSNLLDIPARFIAETEKARKFDVGLKEAVWLPKSQHEWDEAEGIITLPEDVAIEKGMENLA